MVIPVYNVGSYLGSCLDSVLAQDLRPGELEVVAVDDGSTDGSGEILDAYAEEHPQISVIHQENSGWPGRPRNVGVAASSGDFVYFVDADDYLGPEALRRMRDFAVEHGSDVVISKIVGVGGRFSSDVPWRSNQVDVDLTHAFLTLAPMKMFRRSFYDEQGLRFPEGKVRLEDGILLAKAYLTASRVSVLGDYEYYFQRKRETGGNISSQPADPDGYAGSVATILDIIYTHCRPPRHDERLADTLALLVYRRKALKWFAPDRFPRYDESYRQAWVIAVQWVARTRVAEPLDDLLPFPQRVRGRLVRRGDHDALLAFASVQQRRQPPVTLREGRVLLADPEPVDLTRDVEPQGEVEAIEPVDGGFRALLRARLRSLRADALPDVEVVLRERGSGLERLLPTQPAGTGSGGWYPLAAVLLPEHLAGPVPARWDLWLRLSRLPGDPPPPVREHRVGGAKNLTSAALGPELTQEVDGCRAWLYLTAYGNLTLRVIRARPPASPIQPEPVASRSARRVLRWARHRLLRRN
ncbi:MAG: glycosyltransferase [Actinomycetota bacterium]|nr:glycosyltransferase [Actinomycetota bacterium]